MTHLCAFSIALFWAMFVHPRILLLIKHLEELSGCGISVSFFLLLLFSCAQVVIKKSSNDYFFSFQKKGFEQNIISVKKSSFWTKKLSLDLFLMTTWEQKNERKKEPQILCPGSFLPNTGKELKLNPNRDAHSSFSKDVHSNKQTGLYCINLQKIL